MPRGSRSPALTGTPGHAGSLGAAPAPDVRRRPPSAPGSARFYFASLRATFSAGPAEPPPQLKADCQKSVQPDPQGNSCRKWLRNREAAEEETEGAGPASPVRMCLVERGPRRRRRRLEHAGGWGARPAGAGTQSAAAPGLRGERRHESHGGRTTASPKGFFIL